MVGDDAGDVELLDQLSTNFVEVKKMTEIGDRNPKARTCTISCLLQVYDATGQELVPGMKSLYDRYFVALHDKETNHKLQPFN